MSFENKVPGNTVLGGNTFSCYKSVRSSWDPLHTLHFYLHPLDKIFFAFLLAF